MHEIKFDGYRAQLHKRDAGTKVFTRRGYDWSDRFRNIVMAAGELVTHGAILDGEVIVPTAEGRSDFAAFESDLAKQEGSDRLVYYAFDLLHLEVFDLRGCALLDRKRVLRALLEGVKGPIKYSDHTEESGPVIYRAACKFELEGVVSKRADGKYESGRTNVWMKTTCRLRETFVVAGWAEKAGRFDGLYLGREDNRKLVYAGKLERGFTDADKDHILEQLRRLKTKKQPITAPRKFPKARWVKPHVLIDAEFRGKTGEGLLRHPAFKGIRRDWTLGGEGGQQESGMIDEPRVYLNEGAPWGEMADIDLMNGFARGDPVDLVAEFIQRSPEACRKRFAELQAPAGAVFPKDVAAS